ncbi:TonB-dependent receptor [Azoarcus sp. KH32C]|uniref:TonB-dependent receptor n=1 Tax=Azoarcus sp. KH32C TaxID=748247 RepID=UPI00023860DA|nr:TonB-dependent receptor [Azoarcus sp. KH32C]BAL22958.1 putative TonB-dependent receptor [Azoarcus sp. KH32C]
MNIRLSATAVAVAAAFPFASVALAADEAVGETVIVSANRIDTPDVAATYASEVHTRKDIERSGATSLVDYLNRQSSVQLTPNFGNRFTPSINMRGYGTNDGFQNVVISIDGRRLNNIDMVPQLVGAIPLEDIDRIEITKGSGSVAYGDGATAGSIQIYTKPRTGASIDVNVGNHEALGTSGYAGYVGERFTVSATAEHTEHGGFSDKDPSGHKDESTSDNWRASLTGRPIDRLKLTLDTGDARIDLRYPNSLTLAQFRDDPGMNTGRNYTHQFFRDGYWAVGAEYDFASNWRLTARHNDEDKRSEFLQFSFRTDSRYLSDDIALQYLGDALAVTTGVQTFDGERTDGFSETTKKNEAVFVQGQYEMGRLTLSAGARRERVEYEYDPSFGSRLKDDKQLSSWDLGANYRIDDVLSVFGNYNASYQAPDIDRFFAFDPVTFETIFNGLIKPAKVRTVTLGFNHVLPTNRLKVGVFHADLNDEIYFNASTFTNTNIDKSHKYGLEVQDTWRISPILTGVLNYSWTRAIIDRENMGGGAFDGKELPGVPRNNVVLGLNVAVGDQGNLYVSHTWRSKTWAANDFDNNNAQRQRAYQSTDVAYRHRLNKVELYAAVSNLFNYKNGTWVRDDAIYPVDFERTWKLGAKLSF